MVFKNLFLSKINSFKSCPHCGERFSLKGQLQKHMQSCVGKAEEEESKDVKVNRQNNLEIKLRLNSN